MANTSLLFVFLSSVFLSISPSLPNSDSHDFVECTAPFSQGTTEAGAEKLLIDKAGKKESYPSMEEEMAMYIALKENEQKAFFFPNPSNGVLWVEHNLGDHVDLQIINEKGAIVFKANNYDVSKLDLSSFRAGLYTLILRSGKEEVSRSLEVK